MMGIISVAYGSRYSVAHRVGSEIGTNGYLYKQFVLKMKLLQLGIYSLISVEITTTEETADIPTHPYIMELGAVATGSAAGCQGTSLWSSATPAGIPEVQ